jgi:hypothetical protein
VIKKCAEKRLRELSAHNRRRLQERMARGTGLPGSLLQDTSVKRIVSDSAGLMAGVVHLGKSPQRRPTKMSIGTEESSVLTEEPPDEVLKSVMYGERHRARQSVSEAGEEQAPWHYPMDPSLTRDEPIGSEATNPLYDPMSPHVMNMMDSGADSDADCQTENTTLLHSPLSPQCHAPSSSYRRASLPISHTMPAVDYHPRDNTTDDNIFNVHDVFSQLSQLHARALSFDNPVYTSALAHGSSDHSAQSLSSLTPRRHAPATQHSQTPDTPNPQSMRSSEIERSGNADRLLFVPYVLDDPCMLCSILIASMLL